MSGLRRDEAASSAQAGFRCQEIEDGSQMTEDFMFQELRDSGIKVSVNGNDFVIVKFKIYLT